MMPRISFLYYAIPNFYLHPNSFYSGVYNFAEILMALVKKKSFLRTFQVISSTFMCYLMQFGYFAFSENVFDDIRKETLDTSFQ